MENNQAENSNNNQNNNPYGLGLGQFIYVDNPNWLEPGQPRRFFVKNWGNSIEIAPKWN